MMEAVIGKASRIFKASTIITRSVLPSVAARGLPCAFPKIQTIDASRPFRYVSTVQNVEMDQTKKVIDLVNRAIERKETGRFFAVVQVCGKQFKITNNDIIVLQGYWPPTIGDELRLEKVLLLGSSDFTLIGRPILPLNQVSVKATVIEKTWTHTKVHFRYIKRKQYRRIKLLREQLTYLRITSISLLGKVNELGDVDGNVDKIF